MYVTNTHLKPVIGVDIHFVNIPAPCPMPHPYIGIVIDPMDYVPFIGSTVSINGVPRGNTDTIGSLLTKMHIPLGAGFTTPPIIAHESQNFFGSINVLADGAPLSGAGYMLMTCNDVGIPLSVSPGKKMKPVPSLYLPSSNTIPLSWGPPVMVGGPMVPGFSLAALAKGFAMATIMKFAGKLAGAALSKGLKALNKVLKKVPGTEKLTSKLCKMGFEPVDLISGRVNYEYTDFELPGPIPIRWRRAWDSDSRFLGALGHGTHCCYDRKIFLFPEDDACVLLLADGRKLAFPNILPGDSFYHAAEKLTITRKQNGHFTVEAHEESLYYHFNYEVNKNDFRLSLIEDYSGHRIQMHYAGSRLSGITDCVGRRLIFSLDQKGYIESVELRHRNFNQTLIEYGYSEHGELVRITDALKQATVIQYDQDHRMVKKTDRNGHAFCWEYDERGRCVHTWGPDGLLEGWINYQKGFNEVRNSLGETTKYYYNENNLCTEETDSYGNSKYTEYTSSGQLYREIDEEGNCTGYTYDAMDRLSAIVQPDGNVTLFNYNRNHQMIMSTLPDGCTETLAYDEEKRLAFMNYPNGQFSAYTYGPHGLLDSVTSRDGSRTSLHYDEDANLVRLVSADETEALWEYDEKGRCVRSINGEGHTRILHYDALDRLRSLELPDGNHLQLEYNAYEEVTSASDKKSVVKFEYSPLGLLQKRKQNNLSLEFHYDTEQRLRYLTNEAGKIYRFGYNTRGEINRETGFDGITRIYERDRSGLVTKTVRPGGKTTLYEYDPNGRVVRCEYHDGSWEIFNYDKNGFLKEACNQFTTTTFKRNKLGLVEEEMQDEYSVKSSYDANGNRLEVASSLGALIKQERDRSGNVSRMAASVDDLLWDAQLKYNRSGQEISRLMPGNLLSRWKYDQAGRPSEHAVTDSSAIKRWKQYHWESDDRLSRIFDMLAKGTIMFRHDDFGNLIWAQYADNSIVHRKADDTGNLYENSQCIDRKYGAGGQLLETKQHIYKYDDEGNLLSKTGRHTYAKWKYNWYANGMLQDVVRPDGKVVSFKYDALGRRIEKCFDGTVTRWLWDGNVPLHEWEYSEPERPLKVIDEYGAFGFDRPEPVTGLTTWVFDAESFRPAAKISGGGACSIVCDYLGTPQEMYDDGGQKVWEGVLDIYGRIITLKGERGDLPFRYQGQYEDVETGLYYNRFRYYDAAVGGYISQDIIGLAGGARLHSYVKDVNIWTDPNGLTGRYHGKKPTYENPGHHQPGHPAFRGGGKDKTSIIPKNADQIYRNAIPDAEGRHWYAMDEAGEIHRFGNSNDGKVHWNGSSKQGRGVSIPKEVQNRFNSPNEHRRAPKANYCH